jgi:hypothetical protein
LSQERVEVEGTIQGLLSTCAGEKCTPQKAVIIAALEDVFVLVSDEDTYYLLPNIKNSVLSRYLNDKVRVTGTLTLEGFAIQVETAEANKNGEWVTFWSPEIKEQIEVERERLERKLPPPGARRRTRQKVGGRR